MAFISRRSNELRDYAGANQHIHLHLSRGTQHTAVRSPSWAASLNLPMVPRFVACGGRRPVCVTSTKFSPKNVAPPFFSLSGAKKPADIKDYELMVCVEKPRSQVRKMALWDPRKGAILRHFSPSPFGAAPGPRSGLRPASKAQTIKVSSRHFTIWDDPDYTCDTPNSNASKELR